MLLEVQSFIYPPPHFWSPAAELTRKENRPAALLMNKNSAAIYFFIIFFADTNLTFKECKVLLSLMVAQKWEIHPMSFFSTLYDKLYLPLKSQPPISQKPKSSCEQSNW